MKEKLTVILDNGHGGMINGIYQTKGKRSLDWGKGVLYEGMFNRWVVNRLIEKLDREEIPYYHVSPELTDYSLWSRWSKRTRVGRINSIFRKNRKVWVLSVHANAGGGSGSEFWTSIGWTKSDLISSKGAEILEERGFYVRKGKKGGDKEKKLAITGKTYPPSTLFECDFMDSKIGYKRLWDEDFLEDIVDALFELITYIYDNGI